MKISKQYKLNERDQILLIKKHFREQFLIWNFYTILIEQLLKKRKGIEPLFSCFYTSFFLIIIKNVYFGDL